MSIPIGTRSITQVAATAAEAARKLFQGARFVSSVPNANDLPEDTGIEIAFAGRSNTGKSSAINVLCGQRGLARTSRTPGRTRHLVVFELGPGRRLVDLPGFGYAKVSKRVRAHWDRALPDYLERRRSLAGLIMVVDIRHPLKPQEEILVDWCAHAEVPLHILLNKCDKLNRGQAQNALLGISHRIARARSEATIQLFSALKRTGLDEAHGAAARWLDLEQA